MYKFIKSLLYNIIDIDIHCIPKSKPKYSLFLYDGIFTTLRYKSD